ncbi:low molecular weight phosphotyrosine protein phosphatase [Sphingomonas sp. ABOLD]|uniref:protein-tyrosine-phosphatase n=1 Tax=Sphingomonas trueperi TaxID=53317 RepID=A0A7X5Y0B3_9SPHN|nr:MULTISPECIES: low molecular weight protein-tyrosine-phosphatase [Sphingomonas]NJB98260.1 protein-tyrosine phosphatase [Sphingomonas trueperi]RSV41343.1 low molecular weight phosphotyrosine protein phosphatase [Sphingomonas sp. ABOLD]RSV45536.1 low molecular weight phosphotyrosine protein phosphatase [Sphingomonas sp. ABOLE]
MAEPAFLFVCLGNICRSPLAEAAFRAAAEDAGVAVIADSAGTGGWHAGEQPDRRSIAAAAKHGIDITGQRARQVTREDFDRFDHILALDPQNLADLRRIAPDGARARLRLLLDAVPGWEGRAVDDPYYGGPEGFDRTWAEVRTAADRLVEELVQTR